MACLYAAELPFTASAFSTHSDTERGTPPGYRPITEVMVCSKKLTQNGLWPIRACAGFVLQLSTPIKLAMQPYCFKGERLGVMKQK